MYGLQLNMVVLLRLLTLSDVTQHYGVIVVVVSALNFSHFRWQYEPPFL